MRPSLQRRLTDSIAQRQADLEAMFEGLGLRPCQLRQPFDPAQMTDYFHAGGLKVPAGIREETLPGPLQEGEAVEASRGSQRDEHRQAAFRQGHRLQR
jgi:hypothetical protein